MSLNHPGRFAGLILAAAALAGAAPASAATPSITGDSGTPVPLTSGMTLRHMAPDVTFAFSSEEKFYAARVVGPAGAASTGTGCVSTDSPLTESVRYQGNGTYTVFHKTGGSAQACESASEASAAFNINAGTSITPPDRQPLLMRSAGSGILTDFKVPVVSSPGAESYEFRFARNAVLGPDGGITGTSESAFVNTGTASVRFTRPGRYTLVARAKSLRSDVATPWSARVDVRVVAPFDFVGSPRLSDARGPVYTVVGRVREPSAKGRVKISLGKGRKPTRFKRLGSPKMSKSGKFKLKFRVSGTGTYGIRFSYAGSSTVSRGSLTYPIKFFRIR